MQSDLGSTDLRLAEDGEKSRHELAEDRHELVLGQIVLHELCEDLKGTVHCVRRDSQGGNEVVEQVRVLIRPIAVGDGRHDICL